MLYKILSANQSTPAEGRKERVDAAMMSRLDPARRVGLPPETSTPGLVAGNPVNHDFDPESQELTAMRSTGIVDT